MKCNIIGIVFVCICTAALAKESEVLVLDGTKIYFNLENIQIKRDSVFKIIASRLVQDEINKNDDTISDNEADEYLNKELESSGINQHNYSEARKMNIEGIDIIKKINSGKINKEEALCEIKGKLSADEFELKLKSFHNNEIADRYLLEWPEKYEDFKKIHKERTIYELKRKRIMARIAGNYVPTSSEIESKINYYYPRINSIQILHFMAESKDDYSKVMLNKIANLRDITSLKDEDILSTFRINTSTYNGIDVFKKSDLYSRIDLKEGAMSRIDEEIEPGSNPPKKIFGIYTIAQIEREGSNESIESARKRVVETLIQEKSELEFRNWVRERIKKAKIEFIDDRFREIIKQIISN